MPDRERYQRQKRELAERGTTAYRQRVAPSRLKRLDVSASQAEGHHRKGEESIRQVFGRPNFEATIYVGTTGDPDNPPRTVTFWSDRPTQVRAGKYTRLTRDLREERITPEAFERKVRRMHPIGGMRPVHDPRAVQALMATTAPKDILFDYRGRQRPRRAQPTRPRPKRGGR